MKGASAHKKEGQGLSGSQESGEEVAPHRRKKGSKMKIKVRSYVTLTVDHLGNGLIDCMFETYMKSVTVYTGYNLEEICLLGDIKKWLCNLYCEDGCVEKDEVIIRLGNKTTEKMIENGMLYEFETDQIDNGKGGSL